MYCTEHLLFCCTIALFCSDMKLILHRCKPNPDTHICSINMSPVVIELINYNQKLKVQQGMRSKKQQ